MEDEVAAVNDGIESSNSGDSSLLNDAEENNANAEDVSDSNVNDENFSTESLRSQTHHFDLNLPASHSYLGTNLEELRGRTILDEGIYMNLPLLIKESIVLFPGQTLPMAVFHTNEIEMLTKCINKNHTFGVVCLRKDNKFEFIGTTAEIYEYTQGNLLEGFRIKAKGRQRFKILQIMKGSFEILANVKIIPEIILPHPFLEPRSLSIHCQGKKPNYGENQKVKKKIERWDAAITYWPFWIYRQYDPQQLALKIRQQLLFIESRGSCIPTDPIDLSFWVAQNLPLSDRERVKLLQYDCSISRLQWELKYLTNDRILICSNCGKLVGKQSDIFPMSKEGPQSTFCNSGGFIHDTVTLYQAENLELYQVPPSSEYSWFPGYAWTTARCRECKSHMGWQFTAEKDKALKPPMFWGLTRRSLKSKKIFNEMEPSNSLSKEELNEYNYSDSDDE